MEDEKVEPLRIMRADLPRRSCNVTLRENFKIVHAQEASNGAGAVIHFVVDPSQPLTHYHVSLRPLRGGTPIPDGQILAGMYATDGWSDPVGVFMTRTEEKS